MVKLSLSANMSSTFMKPKSVYLPFLLSISNPVAVLVYRRPVMFNAAGQLQISTDVALPSPTTAGFIARWVGAIVPDEMHAHVDLG